MRKTDIANRFALALNYQLQYGQEFTGAKKAFLTGWQTNMIVGWQSGKPFSILNSGSGADQAIEADGKLPRLQQSCGPAERRRQ